MLQSLSLSNSERVKDAVYYNLIVCYSDQPSYRIRHTMESFARSHQKLVEAIAQNAIYLSRNLVFDPDLHPAPFQIPTLPPQYLHPTIDELHVQYIALSDYISELMKLPDRIKHSPEFRKIFNMENLSEKELPRPPIEESTFAGSLRRGFNKLLKGGESGDSLKHAKTDNNGIKLKSAGTESEYELDEPWVRKRGPAFTLSSEKAFLSCDPNAKPTKAPPKSPRPTISPRTVSKNVQIASSLARSASVKLEQSPRHQPEKKLESNSLNRPKKNIADGHPPPLAYYIPSTPNPGSSSSLNSPPPKVRKTSPNDISNLGAPTKVDTASLLQDMELLLDTHLPKAKSETEETVGNTQKHVPTYEEFVSDLANSLGVKRNASHERTCSSSTASTEKDELILPYKIIQFHSGPRKDNENVKNNSEKIHPLIPIRNASRKWSPNSPNSNSQALEYHPPALPNLNLVKEAVDTAESKSPSSLLNTSTTIGTVNVASNYDSSADTIVLHNAAVVELARFNSTSSAKKAPCNEYKNADESNLLYGGNISVSPKLVNDDGSYTAEFSSQMRELISNGRLEAVNRNLERQKYGISNQEIEDQKSQLLSNQNTRPNDLKRSRSAPRRLSRNFLIEDDVFNNEIVQVPNLDKSTARKNFVETLRMATMRRIEGKNTNDENTSRTSLVDSPRLFRSHTITASSKSEVNRHFLQIKAIAGIDNVVKLKVTRNIDLQTLKTKIAVMLAKFAKLNSEWELELINKQSAVIIQELTCLDSEGKKTVIQDEDDWMLSKDQIGDMNENALVIHVKVKQNNVIN